MDCMRSFIILFRLYNLRLEEYQMTPFYEKAKNLWQSVQNAQILKGLQKYPEPFNPHNWTPQELLNHALEESVDLVHYLVGMKDLLDEKDDYIKKLEAELVFYRKLHSNEINNLPGPYVYRPVTGDPLRKPQKSPFEEQYPKYFEPDDQ